MTPETRRQIWNGRVAALRLIAEEAKGANSEGANLLDRVYGRIVDSLIGIDTAWLCIPAGGAL
jgi:hypothetical protein